MNPTYSPVLNNNGSIGRWKSILIISYLIVGVLIGAVSAGISLFLGYSVWWSIVVYSAAGALSMFLSAAVVVIWPKLLKVFSGKFDLSRSTVLLNQEQKDQNTERKP
jgi:membrane protein YdbS with pleckstrin-like domain